MTRLNGWQRLWVLLSMIYGLAVFIFSLLLFPDSNTYDQRRVYAYIESASKYNNVYNTLIKAGFSPKEIEEHIAKGNKLEESKISDESLESPQDIRNKYYSDLSDAQLINKIREKYYKKIDFNKIESEYQKDLNALKNEKFQFIGLAMLAWVIPIGAIYLLGMSIKWVIQGFQRGKSA